MLASVHYYATKFPEPLKESLVHTWKNAYTAELRYSLSGHGGFEQRIHKIISMTFQKQLFAKIETRRITVLYSKQVILYTIKINNVMATCSC